MHPTATRQTGNVVPISLARMSIKSVSFREVHLERFSGTGGGGRRQRQAVATAQPNFERISRLSAVTHTDFNV